MTLGYRAFPFRQLQGLLKIHRTSSQHNQYQQYIVVAVEHCIGKCLIISVLSPTPFLRTRTKVFFNCTEGQRIPVDSLLREYGLYLDYLTATSCLFSVHTNIQNYNRGILPASSNDYLPLSTTGTADSGIPYLFIRTGSPPKQAAEPGMMDHGARESSQLDFVSPFQTVAYHVIWFLSPANQMTSDLDA